MDGRDGGSGIKRFTIAGERCSGTNYLQKLIEVNFGLEMVFPYGFKHWIPWPVAETAVDPTVLVIGIERDMVPWLNSLAGKPHHLHPRSTASNQALLSTRISSHESAPGTTATWFRTKDGQPRPVGRLIESHRDIFELRRVKSQYLRRTAKAVFRDMYVFVRYEYLLRNWRQFLLDLQRQFSLTPIVADFPQNYELYAMTGRAFRRPKPKPTDITPAMVSRYWRRSRGLRVLRV